MLLLLLFVAVLGAGLSGCGAGTEFTGKAGSITGNYNAIITATAGSVVHTATIPVGLVQ